LTSKRKLIGVARNGPFWGWGEKRSQEEKVNAECDRCGPLETEMFVNWVGNFRRGIRKVSRLGGVEKTRALVKVNNRRTGPQGLK